MTNRTFILIVLSFIKFKKLKRFNSTLIIFLLCFSTIYLDAQNYLPASKIRGQYHQHTISYPDSIALASLPELRPQIPIFKNDLPTMVDNSTQPYFRPLFEQLTIECGQYSGIAFNFTYEMNYARNTPANIPENQYSTHYTFNFMNGGYGWEGVSYFHSWEIVKANGHPNVADYGGMNPGGVSMWLSGYDKYYNGMFNKIDEVYQVHTDTEEGLLQLKHWIDNHMAGEEVGGIASFYSSSPWNATTLPEGTPEGGKHVISGFIGNAGHANTIVGYNDSIRYDYNGDGLYTDTIDINNDGIVNLKDREIGGLKFTDSYIGGNTWADSGFCYMMYNTLAREIHDGGIWNQAVHVVKVKPNYEPKLTFKVNLRYNCRHKIKVMAGVADDIEDTSPDYVIGYPIFDYQGSCQYMQGGWEPEALDLEFGIDVTPLLGRVTSGTTSKFFLLIDEDDPLGWGTGNVIDFSLMDYTQGLVETSYPLQYVPLVENGLTQLEITSTVNFDQLKILNDNLPLAYTNEPYSVQMEAGGGAPPYHWTFKQHYNTDFAIENYPAPGEVKLSLPDTIHSFVKQTIDFEFPFYDKTYDSIYVHTDGFLMFDGQEYPWPYMHDENLMLRSTKNISPFLNFWLRIDTSLADGIWYEGTTDYAAFRWKVSSDKLELTDINFSVILYPNGKIEYYYGGEDIFIKGYWASGISNGDGTNYKYLHTGQAGNLKTGTKITMTPEVFPAEMSLSPDGLFSGTPGQNYEGINVEFEVKDYNNLILDKTFEFYSYVEGVNDQQINNTYKINCYPNPVKSEINLEFNLPLTQNVAFRLTNIFGQEFSLSGEDKYDAGEYKLHWDFSKITGLSPGVYYLSCFNSDQIIFTRKIIYLGY